MTSVITTINYPTEAVKEVANRTNLIVVGDKKTPKDWEWKRAQFIGIDQDGGGSIKQFLPENHYCRKNLGYLAAIANGADCIYDLDDDNIPNENWKQRSVDVEASESIGKGWYNVYDLFSETYIWPRGFPLKSVREKPSCGVTKRYTSSIQQGLSDGEPDVDAIWRLVINKTNSFEINKSVYLKPGAWCPFNSQSTWWFPKAYPLMYLPIHATFRMTDIWRSFLAQRCLWELGEGVTFHSPAEVFQDRNEHDLLKDFESEVPGYLKNDFIVETLDKLTLNGDVCENLVTCYRALVDAGVLPMQEVRSVLNWVKDIQKIWKVY